MRGASAFKRSNNQHITLLNYVSRMQAQPCDKIKGTAQNGKKHPERIEAREKTPNRKQSKVNAKKIDQAKEGKKEKKEIGYEDFQYFQRIVASKCYQQLNQQYSLLKREISSSSQKIKDEIMGLNRDLRRQQTALSGLVNLKQSLVREVNYLEEFYEDIRLNNYELKCQLYRERGFGDNQRYDSHQDIQLSEMDYEDIIQLQAEIGEVSQGFKEEDLKNINGYLYKGPGEEEERCCICCSSLEENQTVFKTRCGHVHHLECLERWLKIKRECPLCRGEISLTK